MNYEELIDILVEEIYKKINKNLEVKKSIVFIGEKNIAQHEEKLQSFELHDFNEEISECDMVVISNLCLRGISNIAMGVPTNKKEEFVLNMLLKGKSVYVLKNGIEYRKYKNTAKKKLYEKYSSYEEEVVSYGAIIIDSVDEICNEKKVDTEAEIIKEAKVNLTDKETINLINQRLIAESNLRKPHIQGIKNIIVNKDAIITPLAKDYIRINNINIITS